ncbi:hypothetical protein [Amycolatopsis suaedae]|uniref:CU044_5270 family protein n=1 Tax=Amycolatopsis suaedae TaxID=2510978 RepID=A0A4Q7J0T1_9PSEU|nr:hypothetical protein [Amycolatopsis suaedae]RZQ59544.1 hypothetical protein EWH70_33700 [Amycolatopsis suaedae]
MADELDDALRRLRAEHDDGPDDLSAVRARVLAAAERGEPVLGPRRRPRWAVVAVAAAAAVLVAGGAVVVLAPSEPRPEEVQPAAPPQWTTAWQVLDAAAVAARRPAPPRVAGYRWVERLRREIKLEGPRWSSPTAIEYAQREEVWVPDEPTGLWRLKRTQVAPPRQVGGGPPATTPVGAVPATGEWTAPCGRFPPDGSFDSNCDVMRVEADPRYDFAPGPLRQPFTKWLHKTTSVLGTDPVGRFRVAAEVLTRGLLPHEHLGELYLAIADIPGVRVADGEVLLEGQYGVAVGITDGQVERQIVVDPATGRFLGERKVAIGPEAAPGLAPGTVLSSVAVRTGSVDQLGKRPG